MKSYLFCCLRFALILIISLSIVFERQRNPYSKKNGKNNEIDCWFYPIANGSICVDDIWSMIVSINVTAIAMPISQNNLYFSIDGQIKYAHNTHTFRMTIDRILLFVQMYAIRFLLSIWKLKSLFEFMVGASLSLSVGFTKQSGFGVLHCSIRHFVVWHRMTFEDWFRARHVNAFKSTWFLFGECDIFFGSCCLYAWSDYDFLERFF